MAQGIYEPALHRSEETPEPAVRPSSCQTCEFESAASGFWKDNKAPVEA